MPKLKESSAYLVDSIVRRLRSVASALSHCFILILDVQKRDGSDYVAKMNTIVSRSRKGQLISP